MQKVRKAVIPIAGFGTRFLPATKAQPKEMLPVVDKPTIQYIVEAAVKSGITEIIIVTSGNKRAVEDHFDRSPELEKWLQKVGKTAQLKQLRVIPRLANFIYIRQKGGYGNGTPILNAEPLIGDEPFGVFWGDEFFTGKTPWIRQMIKVYEKYQDPVLALTEVAKEEVGRYGIIDGPEVEPNVYQIKRIIEKPTPHKTKSCLAGIGGYILTPEIFKILKNTKKGKDGELWLVDAIFKLLKKRPIYAKQIEGTYYDTGSKLGYLQANIEMALRHKDVGQDFKKYLKNFKI